MKIGSYETKTKRRRYILDFKNKKVDLSKNQFDELVFNLEMKFKHKK